MPTVGTSAPGGPNSGRNNLTHLVQQIGDILAQGEDSGTPSQHTELRTKLRSALLRLLDAGVTSQVQLSSSRELAAVLQLLKLTLEKVPHWLSGDSNSLLLEILEKLLPVLVRPLSGSTWNDLMDAIGRILLRIAESEHEQFVSLMETLCGLFTDAYSAAIALSIDPTNSAVVRCTIASIHGADSRHRPVELTLSTPRSCEQLLQATLKSIAEAMAPRPQLSSLLIPNTVVNSTVCLLSCSSVALQAAAMQFITAVMKAHGCIPFPLLRLPEKLRVLIHAAPGNLVACGDSRDVKEFSWRLTALLHSLADIATTTGDGEGGGVSMSQDVIQLALSAATCVNSTTDRGRLLDLVAELVSKDPHLLERNASMLSMLSHCPTSTRKALLEATYLYFSRFDPGKVHQALEIVLHGVDAAQQQRNQQGEERQDNRADGAPPSAKRRRAVVVAHTESEEQEPIAAMEVDTLVPPGLAAVTGAVRAAIYNLKETAISTMAATVEQNTAAIDTLGDVCHALAPIFPTFIATVATETVKSWSGWGALQFGGKGLSEQQLQSSLKLLSSGMEAVVYSTFSTTFSESSSSSSCPIPSYESLIANYEGISTALLACVRGESAGAGQALIAAVLGAHLGVKDLKRTNGQLTDIFEAARGKQAGTQVIRAALLPAGAYMAAAAATNGSGGGTKTKGKNSKQQPAAAPLVSNPFKGLLLRMAKSQDTEIIAALIRSMHIMAVQAIRRSSNTTASATAPAVSSSEIVLHIVDAALSGQVSPRVSVSSTNMSYFTGNGPTHERLTPAVCDWLRPILDILCSDESGAVLSSAESAPCLVDVVSLYLEDAPVSDLEQSKRIAQWLIAQSGCSDGAVRAAVLRHAPLLATPQVMLTLHHDSAHPTHPRERRSAADKIEQDVILALKTQLQAAAGNASKAEDIIQLVGHVGWTMRSLTARMLTLAILVLALEQKDVAVSATAAECLRGIAASKKCSVKELIFSTPRLVEHVGKQLPHKTDLLHELADLIGLSPRALALAVLPRVLPQLFAKDDRVALESLAEQGGISVQRMLLDHGHHALAASLMHGIPEMKDLIHLTEEMIGQDFILLARAILPKTVTEMVAQTGASHEWGSKNNGSHSPLAAALGGGGAGNVASAPGNGNAGVVSGGAMLPEEAVAHTARMLELLASSTGEENETEKIEASAFLADGDHVTRMLKEFGDELEKRLGAQAQSTATTTALVSAGSGSGQRASDTGEGSTKQNSTSYGDAGEVQITLNVLRRILVLVRLTGPFVGRFLPQFMVLLGAAVRPGNHREIKLQGLVGWQLLVKSLSTEAPVQLGGIVNQVVVTLLEGLQEGGQVGAAAARVVEELITACRSHFPDKIRSMPPLPQRLLELRHINGMLQEARGSLTTDQHVELLLESLGDEALSVRSTALQELREVLSSQRTWLIMLKNEPTLQMKLLSALLKSAEPGANSAASLAAQQACAECLGMLGAIDPSRVKLDPQISAKRCSTESQLAIELVTKHLVRLLKTAPNLQTLDSTTLAIQEVLKSHEKSEELRILNQRRIELAAAEKQQQQAAEAARKGQGSARKTPGKNAHSTTTTPYTPQVGAPDSHMLFALLPVEVQAIVRPYLDSKFSYRATGKKVKGVIFRPNTGLSYRRWLALWLTQLIDEHVSGDYLPLLQAIKPVLRHDIPTAMFIAPYAVQIAVCKGGRAALNDVTAEVLAILQAEGTASRDSVLCMQAVFTLLDVLQRWYEEAKIASANQHSSGSSARTTDTSAHDASAAAFAASEWPKVSTFLSAIPKNIVARAAAACGAHARALLHYETYLRATRGPGANPAGPRDMPAYADDEVTFLLEIYSKLEEPDGLEGLMKLRQGGPRPEDQRLAAEKAGSWGEALTLYERDLARQEWPGSAASATTAAGDNGDVAEANARAKEELWSGSQRGYLNCMLQMGHWQGLLAQVEGMTSLLGSRGGCGQQASAANELEASRLAAMGSAAAWRLGRWQQLDRYLENVENDLSALNPDERWEARIGLLLRTAAVKTKSGGSGSTSAASALAAELDAARAEVMGPFSAAAMESYSRAYSHLVKLHMLQEVADAASLMSSGPKERRRTLRWDERLAVTQSSLTTQVPILALRRQLAAISGAMDDVGKCWLQHAQLCRSTGHFDAAVPAVLEAAAACVPGASFERVELLYAKGEQHRAISELHILDSQLAAGRGDAVNLTSETDKNRYRARVILRLAEWTVETGQGTHDDVTGLFENALNLRTHWETGLFKYAAYLDELMQDARARQGGSSAAAGIGMDRLGGKSRIKLGEDRHHLTFLPEVLRNYGRSVQSGSRHIYRSLPRLLTLWFDFGAMIIAHPEIADQHRVVVASIKEMMDSFAKSIPSHCWLISLPQLISRICHKNAEVAYVTRHIVKNTTLEYPQQALWQLAAVSKSAITPRRAAANSILSSAKKAAKTEHERAIFGENSALCEQLIKLCHSTPATNKRVLSARKDLVLTSLLRTMPLRVMIPIMSSLTPSLPPAGVSHANAAERGWRPFGDPVTIAALKDEIEVMPSLQRPKRIVLIGSDGREYPFLAKPKDDLRKDCRMMEAAGVINRIFEEEPAARRRNLYLRRFAVVPITEDCGIIEWVPNTRPLRHCINDLLQSKARVTEMQNYVKATYDRAAPKGRGKLVEWLELMIHTYPAQFHRVFLSLWAEPAAWLNARLNYTRSYAVWCMVGHIAGLGDRHGENVLLDMQSGDAMQIDFGCLFDKGLTLSMPEVVPFRLTHNVIDGFGVAGVEGVYRRSCETTLSVLRKHCGTILSVMDTFVHDPLVEWTPDDKKSRNISAVNGIAEAENPQAKDAMATIEGRLKGTLLGVSARPCMPLSVEGHVHRLIVEATAKENLSRMYIWWAAFQ